jgi:hypothetical protein
MKPAKHILQNNKPLHRWMALLLSGLIILSVIPAGIFHHHHEEEHTCTETHAEGESDVCHISLYHPESLQEECDHEHLLPTPEGCSFCKYSSHPVKYEYVLQNIEGSTHNFTLQTHSATYKKDVAYAASIALLNKSPPFVTV